eukprot:gnl/MRDRNA2_/MRDRNA2_35426_c0_seq1.p1 gnl/MRDRNA2_/MRDRNA2_35426_c0~~gnl/MRDRNA2_/MRDRNA2_35426_c0_seq1.p1  ORF type:complete len:589 (-),score=130.44 gnl/MRDRNA2_/MRDRNA2_35426_c0_seq1:144-1910(-)
MAPGAVGAVGTEDLQKVLEVLLKHDTSGQGLINKQTIGHILRSLEGGSFWTDDKLDALYASALGDAHGVKVESFLQALTQARSVDYDAVRADILKIMENPDWDDGSYAPLLIRLAFHAAGTYDIADKTGGTNGATMRFPIEGNDPDNAGLEIGRLLLEPVKAKYPWISHADLWVLAAYAAIEQTGGPHIEFTPGRVDASSEARAIPPGKLPQPEMGLPDVNSSGLDLDEEGRIKGWEELAEKVKGYFARMGFNEKEGVALLCGGHLYGRCHTDRSGYNGAWVENPLYFSNEYAADMIGDEWMAVMHDTIMPDGRPVPEEIRPAPGKRQYVDMTKYNDSEEKAEIEAPDAAGFPPGLYTCVSDWVNVREGADVSSPILGRVNKETEVNLLAVKIFETACRGRLDRGGWVSIIASGGKTLFERVGDRDDSKFVGSHRVTAEGGAAAFPEPCATQGGETARLARAEVAAISEIMVGPENGQEGAIFGKRDDGTWLMLVSPAHGPQTELIVEGFNEKPRKPVTGQTGYQMMLPSDMVLLWDPSLRKHLEFYAEDEDALREDFGNAYKKMTELGFVHGRPAINGCPFMQTALA